MLLKIKLECVPLRVDADGVARVGATRIPLDSVLASFFEGATPEEIVQQYPSLQLGDVYAVIGFYLRHREEVDAYLVHRHKQAVEIREENQARFPPRSIRDRLLARRSRTS